MEDFKELSIDANNSMIRDLMNHKKIEFSDLYNIQIILEFLPKYKEQEDIEIQEDSLDDIRQQIYK